MTGGIGAAAGAITGGTPIPPIMGGGIVPLTITGGVELGEAIVCP